MCLCWAHSQPKGPKGSRARKYLGSKDLGVVGARGDLVPDRLPHRHRLAHLETIVMEGLRVWDGGLEGVGCKVSGCGMEGLRV